MLTPRALALAVLITATPLAGCGPAGPKKYKVSGAVQFEGRPLDQGVITFAPEDPNQGTYATIPITGGKYESPPDGGLLPGKYKVMISSAAGEAAPPGPDDAPGISGIQKDRIPAKYNANTELTREVKADDPNVFDFDLK